jgi:hypothetical protein
MEMITSRGSWSVNWKDVPRQKLAVNIVVAVLTTTCESYLEWQYTASYKS